VLDTPVAEEEGKAQIKRALAKVDADALAAPDVGYYLDVLQGRLRQGVNAGIGITREGQNLVLDITPSIGFSADGAQFDDASRQLARLAAILVEYRMTLVCVRMPATDPAMRVLAKQRARALARALTDLGVAARRMVVVVPDTAARDDATRVEIELEPIVRIPSGS